MEVLQVLPQILLPLPPPLPPPHPIRLRPPPGWEGSPQRGEQRFSLSSSSSWFAGQRWGAVAAACGVEAGARRAGGGCDGMCAGELGVQESWLGPPQQKGAPHHPRDAHLILAQGLKQGHPSPSSRDRLPPTPVSIACHWEGLVESGDGVMERGGCDREDEGMKGQDTARKGKVESAELRRGGEVAER